MTTEVHTCIGRGRESYDVAVRLAKRMKSLTGNGNAHKSPSNGSWYVGTRGDKAEPIMGGFRLRATGEEIY